MPEPSAPTADAGRGSPGQAAVAGAHQAAAARALIRCLRCRNVLAEWRVVGGELRVVVRLRAQGRNARSLHGAPDGGRRTVVAGPDSTIVCERCGATWGIPSAQEAIAP